VARTWDVRRENHPYLELHTRLFTASMQARVSKPARLNLGDIQLLEFNLVSKSSILIGNSVD